LALLAFDESDRQLETDIRAFLDDRFPAERQQAALVQQHHDQEEIPLEWEKAFWLELGARGWLGLAIPETYGGAGGTALQRNIFTQTMSYYGAPFPRVAITIVAPALLAHASEEMKQRYLPRIAAGEINFCLGYSETNAGTDLASLVTRAERENGHYIVSGQKIWTSRAHRTDYCWLAARTSTEGKKHHGVSLFTVDMHSEGITVEPLWVMDGGRVNITHFNRVRVPVEDRVGEENHGWRYITGALGLERIGVFPIGHVRRLFEEIVALAQQPRPDGVVPAESAQTIDELAQLQVDLRGLECLYEGAVLEAVQTGDAPGYMASQIKVVSSELNQRMIDVAIGMCGRFGQVGTGSELVPLDGLLERLWRTALQLTSGAGTNDVMRDNIATSGLGLPRSR
jgi:alkylation response protein AidB-like acyl-CoA dehydrogenase